MYTIVKRRISLSKYIYWTNVKKESSQESLWRTRLSPSLRLRPLRHAAASPPVSHNNTRQDAISTPTCVCVYACACVQARYLPMSDPLHLRFGLGAQRGRAGHGGAAAAAAVRGQRGATGGLTAGGSVTTLAQKNT